MGYCKNVKGGFSPRLRVLGRVLGRNEQLASGRFEGEAVFLNRVSVLRSPELRENVGHSRNPKKSVMDQA